LDLVHIVDEVWDQEAFIIKLTHEIMTLMHHM
jgi:hypothetical protein